MDAADYVLLAFLGAYAVFAVRRLRKKDACGGDCGACRGCKRAR